MSGTAKEAERAQALRHRAAQGDNAAIEQLKQGENTPDTGNAEAHDVGEATPTP